MKGEEEEEEEEEEGFSPPYGCDLDPPLIILLYFFVETADPSGERNPPTAMSSAKLACTYTALILRHPEHGESSPPR